MPNNPRMLEGYRVLDFTQFVAGPTCSRLLGEMGAEVFKVELAPHGDRVRGGGLKPLAPEHKGTSHSSYYLQHNHSKLSFAIDIKKPGGHDDGYWRRFNRSFRRDGSRLRAAPSRAHRRGTVPRRLPPRYVFPYARGERADDLAARG